MALHPITQIEVETTIKKLKDHKAPGPSGITSLHLKFMTGISRQFLPLIVNMFNQILDRPSTMLKRYEYLYEYRACFLPKYDQSSNSKNKQPTKYRPIAIGEQILVVLHKILKTRLMNHIPLSELQFAF
jgi:hypothetical protein